VSDPRLDMPQPAPVEQDYLPRPCELHPERVVEYPSQGSLPTEARAAVEQWEAKFGHEDTYWGLSTAPGTKLGGHAAWIQGGGIPDCACGHAMEHLLTIASWEFHGRGERWLPVEDIEQTGFTADESPFDNVELDRVRRSTGIMLGDAGSLYLFVCRRCEGWPIDSFVEMS
jgi:hypothetical protein